MPIACTISCTLNIRFYNTKSGSFFSCETTSVARPKCSESLVLDLLQRNSINNIFTSDIDGAEMFNKHRFHSFRLNSLSLALKYRLKGADYSKFDSSQLTDGSLWEQYCFSNLKRRNSKSHWIFDPTLYLSGTTEYWIKIFWVNIFKGSDFRKVL